MIYWEPLVDTIGIISYQNWSSYMLTPRAKKLLTQNINKDCEKFLTQHFEVNVG